MQTRAAILDGVGQDWKVETISLAPPKAGEVVLELVGSGLCHSDEHMVTGDMALAPEVQAELGIQQFPIIGGHEGAGRVVEVGPGVTTLEVGDHVVLGFIPSCGRCPSCAKGQQNLCDMGAVLLAGRQITDMTSRHHRHDGSDLGIMCCIGTRLVWLAHMLSHVLHSGELQRQPPCLIWMTRNVANIIPAKMQQSSLE